MKNRESCWRTPEARDQAMQQQQVGYPRVVGGYVAGYGGVPYPPVAGYVAGGGYVVGADGQPIPVAPPAPPHPHMMIPHGPPNHLAASAPWRAMNAPGSPPLGEGHVPIPLNAETNGGVWGSTATGGAATGANITFSSRPQKPFKLTRILVGFSKTAGASAAHLVGQAFIGTDLQQGEVGNIDLEGLGAGGSFDTWVSFKQCEPGVWIRIIASLLGAPAFTSTTDTATYILTAIGHYLH